MITLGFSIGGMALLMVQYLSGGKWGLLVRRPLEAMSRSLRWPFYISSRSASSSKKLYLWAKYPERRCPLGLKAGPVSATTRRMPSATSSRC